MDKLTLADLYPLEAYATVRPEFRDRVIEHKAHRRLALGEHVTLSFEDRLTMHYQVQEMLRAERIFEPDGIRAELETYNPLIPDGSNWKATMLIEYPDEEERRDALARLRGIEDRVWVRVGDQEPVFAIPDEDMERANDSKTSAVHFLRFELPPAAIEALHAGTGVSAGVGHPELTVHVKAIPEILRESLIADLA
ncbi:MAG: DUF3501 family protein [Chromatiales bacterium]|jgi:hypothetical protein|nr:MAG: DUF3501 family protein [Chromatiales bacterium]